MRTTIENLWNDHRLATVAGAVGALAIVAAVAGYLILKRPEDKSCPDPCVLETTEEAAPVVETVDWPTYGLNNERTRYLDAPRVKPPYVAKWTFKGRKLLEYSPILVRGALYGVNNNGMAFSVKKRTGKARWIREIATRNASAPAYSDRMIYISNLEPGQVIALSSRDGGTLWRRPLPGRTESSPAVVGNKVIAGCECGTLFAFDKRTGRTLWEADLGGQLKASPAISDGVAYIGDYSGTMSAVRVSDGSVEWQSDSQGTGVSAGAFYGTAAVAFGRVYAGSKDGRVYSFNKNTGDLAWSQTIGGEVYAGAVAADTPKSPPSVYFGTYGGSGFYALDARDGSERWTADVGGSVIGAASVIGETVYVANLADTETDAFNVANGQKRWRFKDGAYNPVISDGARLYLTGYKTIYALKPTDDAEVKRKAAKAKQKAAGKKGAGK
ncbi:MAG TPA: PQQ-binding-like beta-propeller repeat protein [Solirubrobacterales bacterium]|nr:PQQ-binding-like beta-propeller repeat protein [Solirubrobacterales bacterium]